MAQQHAAGPSQCGATQWWEQPFRIVQTNLREIDATLDEKKILDEVIRLGANAWMIGAGGIVSFYPSRLPFQHPSPWLAERPSGDMVADALRETHSRGLRLLTRIDFSKLHRDQMENHPDWFYVDRDGQRQVFNGLYATCPSGPYYQERSFEIIGEILERYDTDGFFFNWFQFPLYDYARRFHPICQCTNCRRRFRDYSGMELPAGEDWGDPACLKLMEYYRFTMADLAGRIRRFIKERSPNVCLMLRQDPDVVVHEVNNAVDRPLPLWVNWAGEAGREMSGSYPGRPMVEATILFLDLPYRFNHEQPGLIGLHLAQSFSQGANPWVAMVGTTDQPDLKNMEMARDMLSFHRDHEEYYAGLRSQARVALISSLRSEELYGKEEGQARVQKERRGVYRALLEAHLPFDILPDSQLGEAERDGRLSRYRCLVLPNVAALSGEDCEVIDRFVAGGGGIVATYETSSYDGEGHQKLELGLQCLGASRITARRTAPGEMRSAYLKIDRRQDLPGFPLTELVMLDRAFLHLEQRQGAVPSLALIPPSPYGPPEKTYWQIETQEPGLVWYSYGQGKSAYFPWPIGALYMDHALPEHRGLLAEAVRRVSGDMVQVETDAHPLVEVTVGSQEGKDNLIVHLINYSGHVDRAYHPAIPMRDISLSIAAPGAMPGGGEGGVGARYQKAKALVAGVELPLEQEQGEDRVKLTLPQLGLFEVIVLE